MTDCVLFWQDLTDWITEAGGDVVYSDFTGVLDFLIVPVLWSGRAKQLHHQLVNKHWVDDCLDAGELLPVSYQHVPLSGVREGERGPRKPGGWASILVWGTCTPTGQLGLQIVCLF